MSGNAKTTVSASQRRRVKRQWVLALLAVVVLGLGWRWPVLGFVVPVAMLTGMIGGFFRGRWVCGNLCPRGSFFDRILARVTPNRPVPGWLRDMRFRWVVMAVLMSMMVFQISRNPTDWTHWGRVFWFMCVATTGVGVLLAMLTHERAWCSFCPVGTVARAVGGHKRQLRIDPGCRACRKCDNACPMRIPVSRHRDGVMADRDCLHCNACVASCPFGMIDG
jgi:polyferredoxin